MYPPILWNEINTCLSMKIDDVLLEKKKKDLFNKKELSKPSYIFGKWFEV